MSPSFEIALAIRFCRIVSQQICGIQNQLKYGSHAGMLIETKL
ncbi:hypothetical protein LLB_0917 [Legionella longbeachae D-4968]|nr:hypothetical protein LLB_0917 [Legionella longbeachae D-4968]